MKSRLLALLIMSFMTVSLFAIKVEGVIKDEMNEPVIGASIVLKSDKKVGTITNIDGQYSIEVPDVKNETLIISYLGYKTKHIPLKGRTLLNVELEPDQVMMDEVVVVGYGTVKKSDLTGSVSSIKSTEEEAARVSTFDKMLQGKAAGVTVSTGSAEPGGAVNVRIRGTSSLRGNNSPLYVVDGNIISDLGDTSNPMSQGTGGGNSRINEQNPLSSISPQDIESIEVLKDASATAIYGSQGANGVIMITTKQGKTGKPSVSISATTSFSTLKKEIPMLNSNDYVDFYNSFVADEKDYLTMDKFSPINWQKFSTRTAVSQNYRASVSGKSNKTTYYLALGYADNQGIVKKTNISKYDFRINLDQDISDMIKLKTNTFYNSSSTSMTSGTDKLANTRTSIVRHMISYKPLRGEDPDSGYYDENLTGPDAWFTDYDDDSKDNMFNTNITLDVKPLKWLTLRAKGGMVYRTKNRSIWYGTALYNGSQTNGKAGYSTLESKSYTAEGLAMFNHKFNKKHSINGTVGVVYNSKDLVNTSITGENFFSKSLRAKGIGQAAILYPYRYNEVGEQLFSVLGRLVYNFTDRYVLTTTFRADGSSKFDSNNRYSYFPSFAFAWRANEEAFLKNVKEISNLKLRAGWGKVGNQAISSYQTLATYNDVNYTKPDGSAEPGIRPSRIPNSGLKWETSEQYNVGLDLGLFNQRLSFTLDAYIKNTKDLLQEIALPHATGFKSMWINNGEIQNKGIEISVDATPIRNKDWEWNVGGNITFSNNKIKQLGMSPSDFGMLKNQSGYYGDMVGNNTYTKFPANIFLVGQSVGLYLGYKTNGIMQEEQYYSAENQKNPLSINGREIKPGDVLYLDQDGNGKVDDNDRVILGNPNPDFVFALNSSVSYKKFTLDLAFTGVIGNEIINANLIEEEDVKNSQKNIRKDAFFKAWTPDNRSNSYPRLGYEPTGVLSDRLVEKGNYFKLNHVTLSYNWDKIKSKLFKSVTFTATAANVFTITSYSGYDPDVNTFANDASRMGIDLTSYPASRTYTLGVIANF